jgi:hypothetical protein
VAYFIPKRLPAAEIYATIMFALFMSTIIDIFASFEFKAWGYFDKYKAEFAALWVILGIYPAATVMIINWYPYASKWRMKFIYLLGWAVFSTLYEAATMKFGIIWHVNWNLLWSFLLYPPIYYMLILQLRVYRWIIYKNLFS